MSNIKTKFMAVFGFMGSIFTRLFGGFTNDLRTLIMLMAIDFLSGLVVAGIFKNSKKTPNGALSSKTGFKGICKKCIALTFVLIGHRIDLLLGVTITRTAIIVAYISNELVSIIENAGLMGVPVPSIIRKTIDVLSKESKEDNNDKSN